MYQAFVEIAELLSTHDCDAATQFGGCHSTLLGCSKKERKVYAVRRFSHAMRPCIDQRRHVPLQDRVGCSKICRPGNAASYSEVPATSSSGMTPASEQLHPTGCVLAAAAATHGREQRQCPDHCPMTVEA